MITIRMSQRSDGMDVVEAAVGGQVFRETSRSGAICGLCRLMFAAFLADAPWRAVGADGALRLSGPSIYAMAKLTTGEGADGRVRFRKWRAMGDPSCGVCRSVGAVFGGRCLVCEQASATPDWDAVLSGGDKALAASIRPEASE